MIKKPLLRAVSIFALAGLAVVIGLDSQHPTPRQDRAQDTTWATPENDAGDANAQTQPLDTTW